MKKKNAQKTQDYSEISFKYQGFAWNNVDASILMTVQVNSMNDENIE